MVPLLRHVEKSGSMLQVSRVDHVEVNGLFERSGYGLPARVTKIRILHRIAHQSRDVVQRALLTLFSLLLRLVRLTVSYSFMMSNSTLEMNTVTVRPSR
jgi:hypothetical protein